MTDPIRIDGLVSLQAALKAIDGEAQKELRVVLNEAAKIVATGAQRRAPVRSGKLKASIRVSSQQRKASVSGGSAKVPYFGFIDYGGAVGRHDSVKRPFIKTGRVLYPAFLAQEKNVMAVVEKGLIGLVQKHGLGVDHSG